MTKFLIAVLGATVSIGCAQAQQASAGVPKPDVSTEAMVTLCQDKADQLGQTFCFGFGEGIYQAAILGSATQKPSVCVPDGGPGTTRDKVLDEFLAWVKANPQINKDPAAASVLKFLSTRFPCKG